VASFGWSPRVLAEGLSGSARAVHGTDERAMTPATEMSRGGTPSVSAPIWSREGTLTGWYLCGFGHTPSRRGGYCLECGERLWPERR
jgi:hypothetical protein